jgi:hypothetical protein
MNNGKVLDYEGEMYVSMEDYLNMMIDKVTALGMELDVYMDDFTPAEYQTNVDFIKGFTAATRMLAVDLASLTDDPNRSRFFHALANKMVDIQEAK